MEAMQAEMPASGGEAERPPLLPLHLYMSGCATQEEMNANVTATIARGYTPLNDYIGMFSGAVSICGSAPSLGETYRELRGDVLAINNALPFLLERGVVPKLCMFWDAAAVVSRFAVPHPDITYFVGARCHPSVFERLAGCKLIVWHAGGDHNIAEYLAEHEINEPMVNGGSAGVTRAMFLAYALGYRSLNIFGADSSYSHDGKTHVNGSLVPEKDIMVSIGNEPGLFFRTTPEWCAQVNEFRDIYQIFRHPSMGAEIEVFGGGMLPHMAHLMKMKEAAGTLWNTDGTRHASTIHPESRTVADQSQLLEKGATNVSE